MGKIIGLTGGIGSGKTTVAKLFAELGIDIIDTDVIARELVQPGSECLQKLVEYFGNKMLLSDGTLNRKALSQRIFSNADEKHWVEHLLHPKIREQAISEAIGSTSPYCIIVVPLLAENQAQYALDNIIVVDAPPEQQIKRVMQRDKLSRETVENIFKHQAKREQRLKLADYVIKNNQDEQQLSAQVNALHKQFL